MTHFSSNSLPGFDVFVSSQVQFFQYTIFVGITAHWLYLKEVLLDDKRQWALLREVSRSGACLSLRKRKAPTNPIIIDQNVKLPT